MADVTVLAQADVLGNAVADVAAAREAARQTRLRRLAVVLALPAVWLWLRVLAGEPLALYKPTLGPEAMIWLPGLFLVLLFGLAIGIPLLGAGRSPHVLYRPSEIDVSLDDV